MQQTIFIEESPLDECAEIQNVDAGLLENTENDIPEDYEPTYTSEDKHNYNLLNKALAYKSTRINCKKYGENNWAPDSNLLGQELSGDWIERICNTCEIVKCSGDLIIEDVPQLTNQSTEVRPNKYGTRFGEMERTAIDSYRAAQMQKDRTVDNDTVLSPSGIKVNNMPPKIDEDESLLFDKTLTKPIFRGDQPKFSEIRINHPIIKNMPKVNVPRKKLISKDCCTEIPAINEIPAIKEIPTIKVPEQKSIGIAVKLPKDTLLYYNNGHDEKQAKTAVDVDYIIPELSVSIGTNRYMVVEKFRDNVLVKHVNDKLTIDLPAGSIIEADGLPILLALPKQFRLGRVSRILLPKDTMLQNGEGCTILAKATIVLCTC